MPAIPIHQHPRQGRLPALTRPQQRSHRIFLQRCLQGGHGCLTVNHVVSLSLKIRKVNADFQG
jgi:hypothetical protein